MIIGQGDVTIERIGESQAPNDAVPQDLTLANGSTSGHSHVIRGAIRGTIDGVAILDVPQDTTLETARFTVRS